MPREFFRTPRLPIVWARGLEQDRDSALFLGEKTGFYRFFRRKRAGLLLGEKSVSIVSD